MLVVISSCMDSLLGNLYTSLGVESSKLSEPMSGGSLEPNGLDLSCDKYIKIFQKIIQAKDLWANSSEEGMLDTEQTPTLKISNMPWV